MKAKEYYNKYGTRIINNEKEAIVELVNALIAELRELLDIRHVSTDKGLLTAINQINDKWNAICRKFPEPTLQTDAFKYQIYHQLGITPSEADRRMGKVKAPGIDIPQ